MQLASVGEPLRDLRRQPSARASMGHNNGLRQLYHPCVALCSQGFEQKITNASPCEGLVSMTPLPVIRSSVIITIPLSH
jgi:hypothetical protein